MRLWRSAVNGADAARALVAVLPDGFAFVSDGRGRCVEAARIATAVFRRMGIETQPMACDVQAVNRAGALSVKTGERHPRSVMVSSRCDDRVLTAAIAQEPYRRTGFTGHMVVVGDDWFLDLTAEQFDRPEHAIYVPGAILGPYEAPPSTSTDGKRSGCVLNLRGGGMICWYWRPEVKSFRTSPAWRQDLDVATIDGLVAAIRRLTERAS